MAPKTTAIQLNSYFSQNENKVEVMDWFGQSSDFNPIENLWKAFKERVGPLKSINKPKTILDNRPGKRDVKI